MLRAMGEQDAVRGGFGRRLPQQEISVAVAPNGIHPIGCAQQQYGRTLTAVYVVADPALAVLRACPRLRQDNSAEPSR